MKWVPWAHVMMFLSLLLLKQGLSSLLLIVLVHLFISLNFKGEKTTYGMGENICTLYV